MQSRSKYLKRCASVLLALASAQVVHAQATTPTTTSTGTEATRMNPFEVTESSDNSFRASAVGSGSRLRLELKDTPVAYSVINREFINALGLTDLAEAATWATGNTYYNTDNGGDNFGRPSQYFSRGNLTAQGGADSFGAQRNFYQNSNNGGDAYSVESYDFGRGPNAALFGQGNGAAGDASNGGLAGVSSMQTKRARFDNMRTTVGLEYGSWNYRRASLDVNRPINEKIGVRLNAVDMDRRGWRQWDMETSRGLTLTGTWKITPTLEMRMEASSDRRQSRNTGAGQDERVTGWDGRTVVRGPITNAMFSTTATPGSNNVANASYGTLTVFGLGNGVPQNSAAGLTFSGETSGINRSGNPLYLYNVYDGTVMNYQNTAITRRADDTTRVPLWSRTAPNGQFYLRGTSDVDGDSGNRFGRVAGFGLGRSFWSKEGLPADIFDRAFANSKMKFPSKRWVPTLDKPATEQRSKDANAAITYTRQNLTIEVGGDINENHNETRNWDNPGGAMGGGRSASIDINMIRPDGTPNPGFLDVINTFGMQQSESVTVDKTIRANVGYYADFGRWGNYVFNVQGSRALRDFDSTSPVMSLKRNADSRRWQNDTVSIVTWGSDTVRAYTEPTSVLFTDVDWSSPNNPVILAPRVVEPGWVLSNYSITKTATSYALGQVTAKWWNNRVVFTGALRRDLAVGHTKSAIAQGDRPVGWMGERIYRPDAPADYFTMTYLQRNNTTGLPVTGRPVLSGNRPRTNAANGLSIPNPLYANDRFRDDFNGPKRRSFGTNQSTGVVVHVTNSFSPYINFANTYTPQNVTSLDLTGEARDPVTANGYDFGANFSLIQNKVNLKYNYYIQTRENDNFTPGPSANINTLFAANAIGDEDTTDSGRNVRGAAALPGADYQNRRNYGYEIELSVHELFPGLRITANGSQGWFSTTDRGPKIREYVPANADLFRQILEDAGGTLDTSRHPTEAPNSPGLAIATPGVTGIDQTAAIDAYNNIWINYQRFLDTRDLRVPTQPQFNFVTDYTFQSGLLRGLGVSAGIQWQGRFILLDRANETILDPTNPIPTAIDDPTVDSNDFRYLKGSYNSQMNFRYSFRLRNGNSLGLALRINNPLNDQTINNSDAAVGGQGLGFGGATALRQPDGDLTKPNRVVMPGQPSRFTEPINYRLSATYTFGGGR